MVKITVTGLDRVVASTDISAYLRTPRGSLLGASSRLFGGPEPEALRAVANQPFLIPALEHLDVVG